MLRLVCLAAFKQKFLIRGVSQCDKSFDFPCQDLQSRISCNSFASSADGFVLTNCDIAEPVRLKRQSLCVKGHVRVLREYQQAS